METLTYPLLYYSLPGNAVLGILVGTQHQAVEADEKGVKSTLTDYLQRQYKKTGEYPWTELQSPKMKIFEVKVRTAYRTDHGNYPSSKVLRVPIVAIFGQAGDDFMECFLPQLGENFYCTDAKQLPTLVQHTALSALNQMAPEEVHRLYTTSTPKLDTIQLRINVEREKSTFNWQNVAKFPTLTRLAEQYPPTKSVRKGMGALPDAAWEMDAVAAELFDKIVSTRSNVLIVGNPGTGKSAVLRATIRKINGQGAAKSFGFTFWQLMAQRITASAKYLGEWQQQVEELTEELIEGNGVLWVVDMIQLLTTGGEGPEDSVAAFLTPFLQQNKIQLIGEATPQQLESMRRLLPGFVENFQVVQLQEMPEKQVMGILNKFAEHARNNLKLDFSRDALDTAYRLLKRYYPYQSFPGKAIKFLGQCATEAQSSKHTAIGPAAILKNFVQQTGMPELFLRDELLLDQKALREWFTQRIIGQEAAVDILSGVVKIFKAGLNNPNKPISVMAFAGPTGVGKTASARALADYFFGMGQKKSPLVRIDMSEFQHPGQLLRFIGVGGEPGKLVQDIRERPFSVLLLDEVEKADLSVFDALMTVLDEGMMVDAYGRVTNFRNTIIIMTTNLGASNRRSIGYDGGVPASYESALGQHFRPEFVNRIDQIVVFSPLAPAHIRTITIKELDELGRREGFAKNGLTLEFSEQLINHLSAIGFDEKYGARPLQRAIEEEVAAPLARWLLANNGLKDKKLYVGYEGGIKVT